jgi:copper(I)-binding protein
MKKPAIAVVTIAALGVLLAACGSDSTDSGEQISVSDAWSRVTAPTATMGAVYMNLESADGDTLLSAEVPMSVAGKTEIHETTDGEGSMDMGSTMDKGVAVEPADESGGDAGMDEGSMNPAMMGMREVDSIELPAGEEVSLEPGGFHIMLLELEQPIAEGDTIPVTLTFENAGEVEVDAEARTE